MFFIYLYCHIIACLLYYSFRTDHHWIPAVDFGAVSGKFHYLQPDTDRDGDQEETFMYKFFSMYYNSALSFALVEVNARSTNQVATMFFIYLVNALFNAYIFGIFIDLLAIVSSKTLDRMNELDDIN